MVSLTYKYTQECLSYCNLSSSKIVYKEKYPALSYPSEIWPYMNFRKKDSVKAIKAIKETNALRVYFEDDIIVLQ